MDNERNTFVGKRPTVMKTKKDKAKSRNRQKQKMKKQLAAFEGGYFIGKNWEVLIFN